MYKFCLIQFLKDMNMENNCMEDREGETSTGLNISEGESNEKSSHAMKGNEKIDLVHSS